VAEECVQDAFARALTAWPKTGIPANAGAWLTTVARRQAIDTLRRHATQERVLATIAETNVDDIPIDREGASIPDDRLRLIFTCCHPALASETQVALTLRLLCGLSTAEVAGAFLVSEATMAARLTRGKKKIRTTHIPYRVPAADELPGRVDTVVEVVHLVFTTGHTAPAGAALMRRDLVERALQLARLLRQLLPEDGEVAGLLALIVLTDARRMTRVDDEGSLVLLSEQDRAKWDHDAISEGTALVREALRRRPVGRFALMSAIAAVHAEAPSWGSTDFAEIVGLYDRLLSIWPSPVVALNRAVAVGLSEGPSSGLLALDELASDQQLSRYRYLASARAEFLRQLGRDGEARRSYEEALATCDNEVERAFLLRRLQALSS
jgi:RNA polymerase sigma factor (sigma-70 family)